MIGSSRTSQDFSGRSSITKLKVIILEEAASYWLYLNQNNVLTSEHTFKLWGRDRCCPEAKHIYPTDQNLPATPSPQRCGACLVHTTTIKCEEEERRRNKKWWLQHCVTDDSPCDRLSAGAACCGQATQKQHTRGNGSRARSLQKCTTEDCRLLVWVLHTRLSNFKCCAAEGGNRI